MGKKGVLKYPDRIPVIGIKFNDWTVISNQERWLKGSNRQWFCLCKCGTEQWVNTSGLYTNRSKWCQKCHLEKVRKINTIHDGSKSSLFWVWIAIKERCYNEKNLRFKNYGARGISVCNEWRDGFNSFRDWSLNHGYKKGLRIDRIDNNGNYEPRNCRFVTLQQSNFNRGKKLTRVSEYKGVYPSPKKWYSRITKEGKDYYLGIFTTKEEAALAYNEKAKELFGEFACLNIIKS